MIKKSNLIILTLNIVTILTCLHYTLYSALNNILVILDFILMMLLLLNKDRVNQRFFKFFIFMLASTLICQIINSGGIGSTVILMNFILLLYLSMHITIDMKMIQVVSIAYMLLSYYWLLIGNVDLYNTNTIGTITLIGVCFGTIFSKTMKSSYATYLIAGITIIVSYLLYRNISKSRTSFICGILLIILVYFLPKKIMTFKFIYWGIALALTIGSIAWTKIYVYLFENSISIDLSFSTKQFFTGREDIWSEMWHAMHGNWLTGVGTGYNMMSLPEGGFNVHNSIFNFLVVYGIIIFIIVLSCIYVKFYDMRNRVLISNNNLNYTGLCCVIVIFVHALFETTLISSMFYGPIFTLFLITNTRNHHQYNYRSSYKLKLSKS